VSNAEAPSLPAPIEARLLLRVEALPSERHPPRRHVPLLPCSRAGRTPFHIAELWDQLKPTWREHAARPQLSKELAKKYSEVKATPEGVSDLENAAAVTFESRVPIRLGKWRLLPPEAENDS